MTSVARPAIVAACLIVSALAALAGQAGPPRDAGRSLEEAGGSIGGTVRIDGTASVLRGVDVLVSGTSSNDRRIRRAQTDSSGRYEVGDLPPGEYTVAASKTGYVSRRFGQSREGRPGRAVRVAAAQPVDGVDIALPRGAVIVVRITDRFGDPVSGYNALGYDYKFADGQRRLTRIAGDLQHFSDDRGEIRLGGLAAGEYYIGVVPSLSISGLGNHPRAKETPTFYPGTVFETEARPVIVGAGEEVVVALQLVSARAARIRGVVAGASPAPNVMMMRYSPGAAATHPVSVAADGTFTASDMPPGEYVISAYGDATFGTMRLKIAGEDLDGLVLAMRPAARLRGRLVLDGAPVAGPPWNGVELRPAFTEGFGLLNPPMRVAADGTFAMSDVTGTGVLRLHAAPPGVFLESVLLDGRDVTNVGMELAAYEGRQLDVRLTVRSATIAGTAAAAGGSQNGFVAVAFPDDRQLWTPQTTRIAAARADRQGRFAIQGLPPGRYLVAAVEQIADGEERDPELLDRLRRAATPVAIEHGQTANVALDVIE